jgi:hypothetical protein
MEKSKKYTKFVTINLTLILTISALLIALPAATAQELQSKNTYAFIGAVPNPVGVNQPVLLHVGIPDYLSSAEMGWEGLSITIEDPEGEIITMDDIRTDSTGGTGKVFTPTKVGTYTLQAHFPTQTATVTPFFFGQPYTMTYLASDSPELDLIVQNDPIEYYPGHSLPTEYWTRPIDAQLREWYQISGSWLVATPILPTTNLYAPYNDGPETAHILWTMPVGDTMGGLAGGAIGENSYGIGDAYEGKWAGACIVSGVLYYNKFESGQPQQEVVAVDVRTGEELWTKTFFGNKRISFGQVLYWDCVNYHGAFSYLWVVDGTNWYAFEALTGEWRYNMTNVPSGTNYYGPNGEILKYTVNLQNGWMAQWNSSTVVTGGKTGMSSSWGSQVRGVTYDAAESGYDWNVTIPTNLIGSVQEIYLGDRIIGASISTVDVTLWGINLDPTSGDIGELLFNESWNPPAEWASGNQTISWGRGSADSLVAVLYSKELNNYYGFSLENGTFLWGPTASEHYLNMYDRITTINYGRLISSGCSGIVYCYNVTTGDLLWDYPAADPYSEILWNNNWWLQQLFITDGKVYLGHVEHSPINPLPRGAPFICLDIESGDLVWRVDGAFRQTCWGGKAMIGDSVIVTMNTYDQQLYGIGKGASATTVTASSKTTTKGSSVVLEGTVMDVSPGCLSDINLQIRFSNGVPAVSDESMSEWMKYVYMQFDKPDTIGVDVKLEAINPNGEQVYLGTATTDSFGNYGFSWQPDLEGSWAIMATFLGSGGYSGSTSTTYVAVDPAPETLNADEIAADVISQLPDIPAYLTIDLVILLLAVVGIVVGLVVYLAVKKQK